MRNKFMRDEEIGRKLKKLPKGVSLDKPEEIKREFLLKLCYSGKDFNVALIKLVIEKFGFTEKQANYLMKEITTGRDINRVAKELLPYNSSQKQIEDVKKRIKAISKVLGFSVRRNPKNLERMYENLDEEKVNKKITELRKKADALKKLINEFEEKEKLLANRLKHEQKIKENTQMKTKIEEELRETREKLYENKLKEKQFIWQSNQLRMLLNEKKKEMK